MSLISVLSTNRLSFFLSVLPVWKMFSVELDFVFRQNDSAKNMLTRWLFVAVCIQGAGNEGSAGQEESGGGAHGWQCGAGRWKYWRAALKRDGPETDRWGVGDVWAWVVMVTQMQMVYTGQDWRNASVKLTSNRMSFITQPLTEITAAKCHRLCSENSILFGNWNSNFFQL